MEFLASIIVRWPPDGDHDELDRLLAAETLRVDELAEAGILRRLWRMPGRWANWSLWEASDATALHEALTSLPMYPWVEITVHTLARHPSDPARVGES
jgi:muconolactone D-isomerase